MVGLYSRYGTAVLLCVFFSNVHAVSYTITTIADTTSTFTDFPDASAAINSSGTVAYKGETNSGDVNIYTSASGTPVITDQSYDSEPVIDDAGNVVIAMQNSSGVAGVFNGSTGSFIIDDSSSIYELFSEVAINSTGTVAFVGDFNGGGDSAISKTPPLVSIADSTGAFSEFGISDINDSGVVTYVADFDAGGQSSLYSSTSGTAIFSAIDITSAVINNSNTIAYTDTTLVESNTGGVLLSNGGTFSSFDQLAINNNNAIAVLGNVAGDAAIYVRSSSGNLDKVIDPTLDTLNGNILIGVSMGQQAINDSGQVVFWGVSVDISTSPFTVIEGIYLATPDFLLGDINSDGLINAADYLLLSQFVLGIKTPTAGELNAGDMNQDTLLNTADLVLHSQLVLGL